MKKIGIIFIVLTTIIFSLLENNSNDLSIDNSNFGDLAIVVEGVEVNSFPSESSGYLFDKVVCESGTVGTWSYPTWSLKLNVTKNDQCVVFFYESNGEFSEKLLDGSDPVLNTGLVPVMIAEDGTITIADTTKYWYSYASKLWANAVLVKSTFTDRTPGTVIPVSEIFQMYVWIPRYAYEESSLVNKTTPVSIDFVDTSTTAHAAFTFGTTELSGIWVGKFKQGSSNYITYNSTETYYDLSVAFQQISSVNSTYGLDATSDVHMMKSRDWGAVTYLSQSIYGSCSDSTTCSLVTGNNQLWTSSDGVKASTNQNVTGIYDMTTIKDELVMGFMQNSSGTYATSFINGLDSKYYDSYAYGTSSSDISRALHDEAITSFTSTNAFPNTNSVTGLRRGGVDLYSFAASDGTASSCARYDRDTGDCTSWNYIATSRSVLTVN